jgi:hypothetical protein
MKAAAPYARWQIMNETVFSRRLELRGRQCAVEGTTRPFGLPANGIAMVAAPEVILPA